MLKTGLSLLAVAAVASAGSDDCPHTDETSCNAQSGCVWCNCSALPSSCWNCKDASSLPPSINKCDKGLVPGKTKGTCGQSGKFATTCTYSGSAALAWLSKMGCTNGVMTDCPGGRTAAQGCTDAEFFARTLAAAGAVNLTAGTPTDAGSPKSAFEAYQYGGKTFNLATYDGLIAFQEAAGFTEVPAGGELDDLPSGAFTWIDECPTGGHATGKCRNPMVALGGGKFRSYNPLPGIKENCAVEGKRVEPSFPLYKAFTC